MIRFSPRLVTFVALAASAVAVRSPAEARGKKEEVAAPAAPPAPKADRFHDETGARRPFLERLKRAERKTFVVREGGNVAVEVVPRTSLILHLPVDCANLWNEWYAAPETCTPKHVEGQWWAPYASFADTGIDVTLPAQVVAEKWNLKSAAKYADIRAQMEGVVTYTDTLDKARAWAANPGDWVEERVQGTDGVTLVGAVAKEGVSIQPPRGGLMCLSSGTEVRWEAGAAKLKSVLERENRDWDYLKVIETLGRSPRVDVSPISSNSGPLNPWNVAIGAQWGDVSSSRRQKSARAYVHDYPIIDKKSVVDPCSHSLDEIDRFVVANGGESMKLRWLLPAADGGCWSEARQPEKLRAADLPFVRMAFDNQADLVRLPPFVPVRSYDARSLSTATALDMQPDQFVSAVNIRSDIPMEWGRDACNECDAWASLGNAGDPRECALYDSDCLLGYLKLVTASYDLTWGMFEEDGLNVPALPDATGMVCESAPHEGYATRLTLSPDTPAGVRFRPLKVWVPDYPASWKSTQPMPTRGARGRWDYTVPGASLDELFN